MKDVFSRLGTMLKKENIVAYNAARKTSDKSVICHAPFTNLNFEQNGNITACCYNRKHVLGTFPTNTIEDTWFGEKANELRTYIKQENLGGGCSLCEAQINSGNYQNSLAIGFDFSADNILVQQLKKARSLVTKGKWMQMPTCMEFELSNTCNLECVMCNGYFSSSIRKNVEKLEPMVNPYNEDFIKQLIPFLPYLKDIKFLGGEPFLIDIYYEIWEAIVKHNPSAMVHITTNASVLNQRAKNLLEKLKCSIVISIDSMEKDTYEQIRKNAKFERVMENFEYFYNYKLRKSTFMSVAVCPMTLNWREMPNIVSFCNSKGIDVFFNTVVNPKTLSIQSLPLEKLNEIYQYYFSVELPSSSRTERVNKMAFHDMANQVRRWYERLKTIEEEPLEENEESKEIAKAIENGLIPPIGENDLARKVLREYLSYHQRNNQPLADNDLEKNRLKYRLNKASLGAPPLSITNSVFFALLYLPVLRDKHTEIDRAFSAKLMQLVSALEGNENLDKRANDLTQMEPDILLQLLRNTPNENIVAILNKKQ